MSYNSANQYGFDFLKSEHSSGGGGGGNYQNQSSLSFHNQVSDNLNYEASQHIADAVRNKPNLEKQFDVIHFLQAHRSSGYLAPNFIRRATGIDLEEYDVEVAKMLENNPKISIEKIPDPENPMMFISTYAYQAKYNNVRDYKTLLAQINRGSNEKNKTGISLKDLIDSYDGVEDDLQTLIRSGDVIAVNNPEDKDKILFPRYEPFLVELDGIVQLPPGSFSSANKDNNNNVTTTTAQSSASSQQQQQHQQQQQQSQQLKQEKIQPPNAPPSSSTPPLINSNHSGNSDHNIPQQQQKQQQQQLNQTINNSNGGALPIQPATTTSSSSSIIPNGNHNSSSNIQQPSLSPAATTSNNSNVDVPCYIVHTDSSPLKQIRRGEAIQIGGQWFRISSAVRDGVSLSEQPVRAQAPLSVSSNTEMSQRNEIDGYIRPFNAKVVPVDIKLSEDAKQHLIQSKVARDKLSKLSSKCSSQQSTRGGGSSSIAMASSTKSIASKLLSTNANSDNPVELSKNFVSAYTTAAHRSHLSSGGSAINRNKRPTPMMIKSSSIKQPPNAVSSSSSTSNNLSATDIAKQIRKDTEYAQQVASDPNISLYAHAKRHGCTKDVRNMYLSTKSLIPSSSDDDTLRRLLIKHGLLDANEQYKRKPLKIKSDTNLDNDGKPKKRRYYEKKNQRMTNVHLIGTEIGAELMRAQEKQRQGKSVGDGGM